MSRSEIDKLYCLDAKIEKYKNKIEILRCRAEKCTPVITFMPKGATAENLREVAICEMCDCEIELNELIKELYCLKRKLNKINS